MLENVMHMVTTML